MAKKVEKKVTPNKAEVKKVEAKKADAPKKAEKSVAMKIRKYKKVLDTDTIYAVKADTVVDSIGVGKDGKVVVTYHKVACK